MRQSFKGLSTLGHALFLKLPLMDLTWHYEVKLLKELQFGKH